MREISTERQHARGAVIFNRIIVATTPCPVGAAVRRAGVDHVSIIERNDCASSALAQRACAAEIGDRGEKYFRTIRSQCPELAGEIIRIVVEG